MKISYRVLPKVWLAIVLAFLVVSTLWYAFLWVNSGGRIPLVSSEGYRVSFPVEDADNLVYFSDVRMAGVKVGNVVEVVNGPEQAKMVIELDDEVVPLHEGVTFRVGAKSLVEESYVDVADGTGAALPNGAALGASAVVPSVQLDDVLNSLDPATRDSLGSAVRSLSEGTAGRERDVDSLLTGVGDLGGGGATTLEALAAQSEQLRTLTANTAVLLDAVDTQQGQVAELVDTASQIAGATAAGRADLEASVRQAPEVLTSTATATDKLTELSAALAPVAADLRVASPLLTEALNELPAVSEDLRGLLPSLDGVLDTAPPTLERVPTLAGDIRELVPPACRILRDVNPALAYLQPYGRDMAAFFTNFGGQASGGNEAGNWARIAPVQNEQSLKGNPLNMNEIIDRSNAYPKPGGSANPEPFTGTYPRVEREGGCG